MSDLKIEERISKAIDLLSFELLRDAANRSFVKERSFSEKLRDQVLGPVAVGTLIITGASWTTQWIVSSVEKAKKSAEIQDSRYVELFQKYREAHRKRWINGTLLESALRNGFSSEIIERRKTDYDSAYIATNAIFPNARDYLDEAFVNLNKNAEKDYFSKFFGDELLKVSTAHDRCLTRAYAVRYDWDFALFEEASNGKMKVSKLDIKKKRDKTIEEILSNCKLPGGTTTHLRISSIYNSCADAIFGRGLIAIQNKTKYSEKSFEKWVKETTNLVQTTCSLDVTEPSQFGPFPKDADLTRPS